MPNKFISFNDAINLFTKLMCSGCEFEGVLSGCETTGCQVKREIIEIVNKHPPANVRPVVRGTWLSYPVLDDMHYQHYSCSVCKRVEAIPNGYDVKKELPYCHCGAYMRQDDDDE